MALVKDYGRLLIDVVPYLFPVIDFMIWLLTGDPHAAAGIFGNLLNIGINLALRRISWQFFASYAGIYVPSERETACRLADPEWLKKCGSVVDMPSIHAQQVGYYSLFWLLVLAYGMGTNIEAVRNIIGLLVLLLFGYTVMYARYLLSYSTLSQLIVGYLIGCIVGASYYFLIFALVRATTNHNF